MRIILFVNDGYFAYLMAKTTIDYYYSDICLVVFTNKIKSSLKNIMNIYHKTHWRYFAYRSIMEFCTKLNNLRKNKTVFSLVRQYKLEYIFEADINNSKVLPAYLPADLGIAFNFDQIFRNRLLFSFNGGVINIHSSNLPKDKGVSPVLWAFARGDNSIWSTIYRMDGGIDTGKIFKKFEVAVKNKDTAFSIYERVALESGDKLFCTINSIEKGIIEPTTQRSDIEGNYNGWPDVEHFQMMKKSGRKLLSFHNLIHLIRK